MKKSKLLDVYRTFGVDELRSLSSFVASPYHNKNKHVKKLNNYLSKQHPQFKKDKVERNAVYSAIFPNEAYDDLRLRHISSQLLKTIEDFLVVEQIRKHRSQEQLLLLREYRNRKLTKHFSAIARKTDKQVTEQVRVGIDDYYWRYRIAQEKEKLRWLIEERPTETELQRISDHLDSFYLASKLKQTCEIMSYQHVFKQDFQLRMMDEIHSHLGQNSYKEPLVNLYYKGLLSLMNQEEEAHFFELKELLQVSSTTVATDELTDIHAMARNYAIRGLNKGNSNYYRELFDLYQIGLEEQVLLNENGFLSPSAFKNIVSIGLKLHEVSWVETFIKKFSNRMEDAHAGNYREFALAKMHFSKEEYEQVIGLLNKINYTDLFMMLDSKVILMKAYYELKEIDALDSLLESFSQLLLRKKVLGYHKERYRNTVKYIRQLSRLSDFDKNKRSQLYDKLSSSKESMAEKDWIIEKLGVRC